MDFDLSPSCSDCLKHQAYLYIHIHFSMFILRHPQYVPSYSLFRHQMSGILRQREHATQRKGGKEKSIMHCDLSPSYSSRPKHRVHLYLLIHFLMAVLRLTQNISLLALPAVSEMSQTQIQREHATRPKAGKVKSVIGFKLLLRKSVLQ